MAALPPSRPSAPRHRRRASWSRWGASVGANSHQLLDLHIGAALDAGLSSAQVEAALKMAEYVQQRAAEMTAEKVTHALEERGMLKEEAEMPPSEARPGIASPTQRR